MVDQETVMVAQETILKICVISTCHQNAAMVHRAQNDITHMQR
jgi:hypothetical protein